MELQQQLRSTAAERDANSVMLNDTQAKVAQLQQKIAELNGSLATKIDECTAEAEVAEAMRSQVNFLKMKLLSALSQVEAGKRECRNLVDSISATVNQAAKDKTEINEQLRRMAALETSRGEVLAEITECRIRLRNLETDLKSSRCALAAVKQNGATTDLHFQTKYATMQTKVFDTNGQVAILNDKLCSVIASRDSKTAQVEALEAKLVEVTVSYRRVPKTSTFDLSH